MSRSALSVLVFSLYLFILGPVLVITPNTLLAAFTLPSTHEVWIRVIGALVTILGYYYLMAARREMTEFFRFSVVGRCSVLAFFIAFVLLRFAPPILILFGIIDAAGAVWTAFGLRADQRV